jgi:hypothetical protein
MAGRRGRPAPVCQCEATDRSEHCTQGHGVQATGYSRHKLWTVYISSIRLFPFVKDILMGQACPAYWGTHRLTD